MKVNEIFYSIQGEGFHTGTPAVFVRFSGCNLKCPFCDTDFKKWTNMTEEEIMDAVCEVAGDCRFVVLTGGEPTLQVNDKLISLFHRSWFTVAMETNGTRPWPESLDWVTISPKSMFLDGAECGIGALYGGNPKADEVKVVYNGDNGHLLSLYDNIAEYKYIQPCDTGDNAKNRQILKSAVEWLKQNPSWRLSLQTQKIINVR